MTVATDHGGARHVDAALLILRAGLGVSCLFVQMGSSWLRTGLWLCAVLVACGVLTRIASAAAAVGWAVSLIVSLLRIGTEWYLFPVLATLFVILFAALALAGSGGMAIDRRFGRYV